MDVQSGLAPRALERAATEQRSLLPHDAEALDRLLAYMKTQRPKMYEIKQAVCEFYLISEEEIDAAHRTRKRLTVFARHAFCFFAHKYTRASLSSIQRRIGYGDHTTVLHAVRKMEQIALGPSRLADEIELLRLRIAEKVLQRLTGGRA